MKIKTVLSLIAGVVLFSGCVSSLNDIREIKVRAGYGPENIPQIKKLPIKDYKNMSFDELAKNIYAKPIHKYSTEYEVNCKTISDENNLTGVDYICQVVKIGNKRVWRDYDGQKKIDEKLKKRYLDIENELSKYCIAHGGFILNNYKIHNNIMTVCKLNNKSDGILFGYTYVSSYHSPGIKIYSQDYFNSFNNCGKFKQIEKFLLKHGAIKLGENEFDMSKVNDNILYLLRHFYPNLEAKYFTNFLVSKSNYKVYWFSPTGKQIFSILTKGELDNKESCREPVMYLNKNGLIVAVFIPDNKHLILIDSITNFKVNQIIFSAMNKEKQKEEQKEDFNY
jgi:hypothetical protein